MAWKVDPQRSKIEFVVKHLVITRVRGRFKSFDGSIDINEAAPQGSVTSGTVDLASVQTGFSLRDNNVRSVLFDVKHFPKMSFRSTHVVFTTRKDFKVYGELTVKGVTREVAFDAVDKGELSPVGGKRRWAFGGTITLNRKDFGLKWGPLFEIGGLFVGDEIKGLLEIEVVQE